MALSRLHGLALCTVLAAATMLTGCAPEPTPESQPEKLNNLKLREPGPTTHTLPLRKGDYQTFENMLFTKLNMPTNDRNQFRILETKDVKNGTLVLYSMPRGDGLAFTGHNVNGGLTIFESNWPFTRRDDQDLISVRAVPPNNNNFLQGYGILAGRVYSPFIENVVVSFRDGRNEKINVSHTRGFIIVRKGFDTRFARVRGYDMNGNPYWELDTR